MNPQVNKASVHTLSSTNIQDLRRKNETKTFTGVKLIIRNKTKYESKMLMANPKKLGNNKDEEVWERDDEDADERPSDDGEEEQSSRGEDANSDGEEEEDDDSEDSQSQDDSRTGGDKGRQPQSEDDALSGSATNKSIEPALLVQRTASHFNHGAQNDSTLVHATSSTSLLQSTGA